MTQTVNTLAIMLSRTNFGEADRILTVLTPDNGKRRLMAKGVRRQKSKMAGGIELFCVSNVSYIPGRGEIDTLISTRLKKNYSHIVENVKRTMLGYELLKRLNRATEDAVSKEYFDLLENALAGLDDSMLPEDLLELWFNAQLIRMAGYQPNLKTDSSDKKLAAEKLYSFDTDSMAFSETKQGKYTANHIKLLRLAFSANNPLPLKQLKEIEKVLPPSRRLVTGILEEYIRL